MLKSLTSKSSSLYQLIDEATDNLLESENDELNSRICSEILRTSDGPKVAAKIINKIINKSLASRCSQSIWYCLLLLDLAVKKTHSRFSACVLSKEFFVDLIKILDPKYQVPEFVQEKLHYILKEWYTSQMSVPGYQNLVKFVKGQGGSQPVPTVNSTHGIQFSSYPVQRQPSISYFPEKDKIIKDIDIIETNLSIFSDTLRNINLQEMTGDECQFLKELHDTAKTMQARITDILPQIQWEDIINQLLQVNDNINSTSDRYVRLMASKANQHPEVCVPHSRPPVTTNQTIIDPWAAQETGENNGASYDIYDTPSLPSYSEASSNLSAINTRQVSKEPNLIDFGDSNETNFYKTQPLPPIPLNRNDDLSTTGLTATTVESTNQNNRISSDDFDSFIESIARRHRADSDVEEYAPPLYDEAISNKPSHS